MRRSFRHGKDLPFFIKSGEFLSKDERRLCSRATPRFTATVHGTACH
jgi:hypothetical protein